MTEQLQASAMEDGADVRTHSHEAFVSDLAAWLSTMQHAAPGTCCDMVAPQLSHGLPLRQCWALGQHLQQHATAAHLPFTLNLLQSQHSKVLYNLKAEQQVLLAEQQALFKNAQPGLVMSHKLWQACRTFYKVATYEPVCSACDDIYYDRLRAYLRHVSTTIAMVLAVLSMKLVLSIGGREPVALAFHAWAIVHFVAIAGHLLLPAHQPGAGSWWHRIELLGGLRGFAWALHLATEFALVAGWFSTLPGLCRPMTLTMTIGAHTVLSMITEQVFVWGRWPGWLVRSLMVLEMAHHHHAYTHCGNPPGWPTWAMYALLIMGSVILPWTVQFHWRHLLKNGRSKAAVSAEPEGGGHAHSD